MTTRDEIFAKLDDFTYQKKNFGGFLMNKEAKRSHAMWTAATDKGVTELTLLATRDYGNNNVYDVAAFTLHGDVPDEVAAELAPKAEYLADAANLRAYGYMYSWLVPWDGGARGQLKNYPTFRDLSLPDQGVYVIAIVRDPTNHEDPRWLAWVRENGTLNIAAVTQP